MYKRAKKYLLYIIVTMIFVSMGIISYASEGNAPLKSIKIVENGSTVKSVTLYANAFEQLAEQAVPAQLLDLGGTFSAQNTVTYDVQAYTDTRNTEKGSFKCATNNRAVAVVEKVGDTIKITAKGNGKAQITVSDLYSTRKAVLTVTVKSIVNNISFNNVPGVELPMGMDGKYSLGAAANTNATDKKIKYTVVDQMVATEDAGGNITWKTLEQYKASGSGRNSAFVIKVDSKGNITAGKLRGTATVIAESQDLLYTYNEGKARKKYVCGAVAESVDVIVSPKKVDKVTILDPAPKANGSYDKIPMRTNPKSQMHTYDLAFEATLNGKSAKSSSVTFTSSKESVAAVDAAGKITAVGNGTAVISAIPADGTKLSKKVSVTVEVKTDIYRINVPKDDIELITGKTYKTGAAVDKNVNGSKALRYDLATLKCFNLEGNEVTGNDAVITLESNGKITAQNPGTAAFMVRSADFPDIRREIRVTVWNPIVSLTAKVPVSNESAAELSSTKLYLADRNFVQEPFEATRIQLDVQGKNPALPCNEAITFTSSNPNVVTVNANGDIKAVAKGKAQITVKAAGGSNKSAKIGVEVIQKVTDITVAGIPKVNEELYGYNHELYLTAGTEKVLSAAVNNNANNKKLKYEIEYIGEGNAQNTGISFDASKKRIKTTKDMDGEAFIIISADDKTDKPVQEAKSVKILVKSTTSEKYISQEDLKDELEWLNDPSGSGRGKLTLKKGDKFDTGFQLPADITRRAVTWSSDKKNIVDVKDGVLTAKGAGTAVIKVSAVERQDSGPVEYSFKVYVTAKTDAQFQKEFNQKVKTAVGAEDYTHLGVKPAFSEKTMSIDGNSIKASAVSINITDPSKPAYDGQDGAVHAVLDTVVRNVFDGSRYTAVLATDPDSIWQTVETAVVGDGSPGQLLVTDFNSYSIKCNSLSEAIDTLADQMEGASTELIDWNQKKFYAVIITEDRVSEEFEPVYYSGVCEFKFTMDNNLIDTRVDARIETELAGLGEIEGIRDISYHKAGNTITVDIRDLTMPADNFIKAVTAPAQGALLNIYKEVSSATIYVGDKKEVYQGTNGNGLPRKLLDAFERNNYTNMSDLDGVTARIDATYDFSGTQYTLSHTIIFERGTASIDAQVDGAIEKAIAALDGSGLYSLIGSISYNPSTNKVTVGMKNTEAALLRLAEEGFLTVMDTIVTAGDARTATVTVGSRVTKFEDINAYSEADMPANKPGSSELMASLIESPETAIFRNLFGKKANIKVTYNAAQASQAKAIAYSIEFLPDMAAIDAMIDNQTENCRKTLPGTNHSNTLNIDYTKLAYVQEENALNIVFTQAANGTSLASGLGSTGIKTLMNQLLGVKNVAVPEKITLMHNGSRSVINTNGKMASDDDLLYAIMSIINASRFNDLAGKTIKIYVTYSEAVLDGTLEYAIIFAPMPSVTGTGINAVAAEEPDIIEDLETEEYPEVTDEPETEEIPEVAADSEDEIPEEADDFEVKEDAGGEEDAEVTEKF